MSELEKNIEDFEYSISDLIKPIGKDLKQGNDLRDTSNNANKFFYQLRESRNLLRKEEKDFILEGKVKIFEEKWKDILLSSCKLLKEESKDIEIIAYLLEAITRVYGFTGLQFGFDVAREIIETYKHDLYPTLDSGENIADKFFSFAILNGSREVGSLVLPIYNYPCILDIQKQNYSFYDIKKLLEKDNSNSNDFSKKNLEDSTSIEELIVSIDLKKSTLLIEKLNNTQKSFLEFNKSLGEVFGSLVPSLKNISEILSSISKFQTNILKIVSERRNVLEEISDKEENQEVENQSENPNTNFNKNLKTRESAIYSLKELIQFFEKDMPHSPVVYLLRRSYRWILMPLDEIMDEVIGEKQDFFTQYSMLTGVYDEEKK